jgi:hypothetical protein
MQARTKIKAAVEAGEKAFSDPNVFGYAKELLRSYSEVFETTSKHPQL